MDPNVAYNSMLATAAGLAKLVIIALLLERALAFVFEYHWMRRATERVNGVKAPIAFGLAWTVCALYDFDVLSELFAARGSAPVATSLGILITAGIVAGGSAGAITLFQGVLNFSKGSRDKLINAKQLKASAEEDAAEASALRARGDLQATRKQLGLAADSPTEDRRIGKTPLLPYDRRAGKEDQSRAATADVNRNEHTDG